MTSAVVTRAGIRMAGRRGWRFALLAVGIGLAVFELRGRLPGAAAVWRAVQQSRPGWVLAAVALAVLSMAAFAEQQRQLLAGFGVRMSAPASLAVSYARSAMATALPGGSAFSAGYAFRQFRARGASQPIAGAVMLLSGIASLAGVVLLYAGDLVAWTSPSPGLVVLIATVTTFVAFGLGQMPAIRAARATRPAAPPTEPETVDRPWRGRVLGLLRQTTTLVSSVPPRRWLGVIALAALNWLTDLACLLVALHAVGLAVPIRTVASAYLATQLIRQIPITPGGIGLIEASLILALTTAGAGQAPAAAAVLIYRLLSCWFLMPVGLACWLGQKTGTQAGLRPIPRRPTPVGAIVPCG